MGEYLFSKLNHLKNKYPIIKEVRGRGLMAGVELNTEGKIIVEKCIEKRLLINCTHERVLRLMPALNITKKEIDKAVGILDNVFADALPVDVKGQSIPYKGLSPKGTVP
jgi:acetylornithine/succinyldiaminopimelate/putrescine aminotransferase